MSGIRRIFVEKKPPYASQAKAVLSRLRNYLEIEAASDVRIIVRYDMENVADEVYEVAKNTVFSEPPLDDTYEGELSNIGTNDSVFFVEYLPGQFDQRADSAMQALELLGATEPIVRCATGYCIKGDISDSELSAIKGLLINPVDSRECGMEMPKTLKDEYDTPEDVEVVEGFKDMDLEALEEYYKSITPAMTMADLLHIQKYFREKEHRDPTITEIRIFDTYWSDHCRHTTFSTHLNNISIEEGPYKNLIEGTYKDYLGDFESQYKDRDDKYVCLMDMALMAARVLESRGLIRDKEDSEEINACSIVIPVDVDGKKEEWLLNFKNETHNHPTEIEPFGGAATCIGGAIRDPLSGRTYCYQAMRVTGAADPTVNIKDTIPGKLPQVRIVTEAAQGYSSYGNQIGLATGLVKEIYHPGYEAKRMEIGAVVAAAPKAHVIRERPMPGDSIILLGGRTGRDGVGGAAGSSKAHDKSSTTECGAEVQKGNPPTERKLQRLFRRKDASLLIKRCNDFGAGGVSVAIGELADGLIIDLDKVTKKYAGLDGTELAISESQERMAVCVDKKDVDTFLRLCYEENLEAKVVAEVTEEKRLVLNWRGKTIANIERAFLDTNGARSDVDVLVKDPGRIDYFNRPINDKIQKAIQKDDFTGALCEAVSDLNVASQKGLVERFDSSIGQATVHYPFGGKNQQTPIQTMVCKIPVGDLQTTTVSMMSYGFDPYLSSKSPYHGAAYAVLSSMSKIVAAGGDYRKIRFSFQEYFKRMGEDPANWGLPFSALLGAYRMQMDYGLPAIGGKDSMSGSFEDMDVPPTLCSFAVNWDTLSNIISPEIKKPGSNLYIFPIERDENDMPKAKETMEMYSKVRSLIEKKRILSAYTTDMGGVMAALYHMAIGNNIGISISHTWKLSELFDSDLGSIIVEMDDCDASFAMRYGARFIGKTTEEPELFYDGEAVELCDLVKLWEGKLSGVFPIRDNAVRQDVSYELFTEAPNILPKGFAKPSVFIPVFPGTNTEYDAMACFNRAGGKAESYVFKNNTSSQIEESIEEFERAIKESQIIYFPGGFSAGDEPEGSAKFFAATFRNERLKEAIMDHLNKRDGLMLGICNGFQALVKLGLVPFGDIRAQSVDSPTLTYNTVGRHIARISYTKVISSKSPWFSNVKPGEVYAVPISHGEGRFVAPMEWIERLYREGQVATRYVAVDGSDINDADTNPNGSYGAIEGITSPDGRVLGKMGHIERIGNGVGSNIFGAQDMKVFEAGVSYFK